MKIKGAYSSKKDIKNATKAIKAWYQYVDDTFGQMSDEELHNLVFEMVKTELGR
jgi:hypothetical protein